MPVIPYIFTWVLGKFVAGFFWSTLFPAHRHHNKHETTGNDSCRFQEDLNFFSYFSFIRVVLFSKNVSTSIEPFYAICFCAFQGLKIRVLQIQFLVFHFRQGSQFWGGNQSEGIMVVKPSHFVNLLLYYGDHHVTWGPRCQSRSSSKAHKFNKVFMVLKISRCLYFGLLDRSGHHEMSVQSASASPRPGPAPRRCLVQPRAGAPAPQPVPGVWPSSPLHLTYLHTYIHRNATIRISNSVHLLGWGI